MKASKRPLFSLFRTLICIYHVFHNFPYSNSTFLNTVKKKCSQRTVKQSIKYEGAFFWDYSGYSYSDIGVTEYTELQFRKERSFWKRNTYGGGDLRTTMYAHAQAAE